MKQSNQQIELNYNSNDLFNIVLDIDKYPDYIPWCSSIDIIDRKKNQIRANMIVNYKLFPTQKFTSIVFYNLDDLFIKTKYIEGPLKNLDTMWKFKKIKKNKSTIFFSIQYEFKNFFHQKFSEFFFPLIEKQMINSFIKRAEKILN